MSIKIHLDESEIPRQWYNIAADLPKPVPPPLKPDGSPVSPQDFEAIFPPNIIAQENSTERWIDIPGPILDSLYRWRPAPLRRAPYLERFLKTPARIWYKDESTSPAGSHKPNSAVGQAWYNKEAGTRTLTTETGAGQWGSALSLACNIFGLECKVFMVRISFDQKPFRKIMMQVWGGNCVASPSTQTSFGRAVLERDPNTPGSLGIAISEAVEMAATDTSGKTKYALGSVLNHVLLHQTLIGLEAKKQLSKAGVKKPDIVIGCVGGGSNFAGLAFPFIADKIAGQKIEIIPVEPTSCPSTTRGIFAYDHGDSAGMTPLVAMHTLGHAFVPEPIHAGGLRYHGMAPQVSAVIRQGLATPRAIGQLECFEAALTWARTEGAIVAPETSHAIAAVIQEALKAKEEGQEKDILFNLSGHGHMDLAGYDKYLSGQLSDHELPQSVIDQAREATASFPRLP
ncbi:MAG: TrpB-like pyridoxal phosphate-dependent enzyme [Planctomycetes bacterium]|nr:TrpB-like pyridoxal phosphate-dependent enzyme [Planctomycetota bacterium]